MDTSEVGGLCRQGAVCGIGGPLSAAMEHPILEALVDPGGEARVNGLAGRCDTGKPLVAVDKYPLLEALVDASGASRLGGREAERLPVSRE